MSTEALFADAFVDDPAAPTICDRSTLERFATCPRQGYAVHRGLVSTGSTLADIGNAVHDILAWAVSARRNDHFALNDLREGIEVRAVNARPDIQPEVIACCRRTYAVCDLICRHYNGEDRAPEDLLIFDGGKDEQSGQIAADLMPPNSETVRLTCEVDLLMATASAEEVDLIDWKSGWKHWTAGAVKSSFQLGCFYPYMIFRQFPKVNRVTTSVFMPRDGGRTSPVESIRDRDFWNYEKRIISAVNLLLRFSDARRAADVPIWAAPEKCCICPAVQLCADAHTPAASVAKDTEGSVRQLAVMEAAGDALRAELSEVVRKGIDGVRPPGDLVFDGIAFGVGKPARPKAKSCAIYGVREGAEEITCSTHETQM